VTIWTDKDNQAATEATVKVRVGGRLMLTASEGDGPVNALDGALRKALEEFFPNLSKLHLVDYKVRVVNARAESAARVRVVIEWRFNGGEVFGTVGVSENVVEASWLALQDAFEYKWLQEQGCD
jgi:2-isopropylmalate synthase